MSDRPESNLLLPQPQDVRRTVALICFCAAVGLLAIAASQEHLASIVEQARSEPEIAMQRLRSFAKNFALAWSFGLLAVAVWLRSVALRTFEEERFPPAGARVVRPTPVVTGYAARLRARAGLLCSFLLVVSAFALPISLLSLLDALAVAVR